MTATTSEHGLRARLHRLTRGAVVFAVGLGLSGFVAGGAATAATDAAEEAAVELHVAAGARGTVVPGSATTASLTVDNAATSRLSGGLVTVELNRTPLTGDTEITAWLDDEEAAGSFDELGSDTTEPIDPDASATTSMFIPAETLGELAPGVYPLRATLTGATTDDPADDDPGSISSTSVLVVTGATTPVAVVVPVMATPADGALLTLDEVTALTAADGALTATLDGVTGTSAILAIDPAIPASIRALGSAAPQRALDWMRQLDGLPNERFALQFADADAATQAQAGLTALLQPTTLAPFLSPANFVTLPLSTPTPTPTPTATPSQEPGAGDPVALPDDETLTEVAGATTGVLWPRSDVSDADLAAFAGYLGDDALTVLSSTAVSGALGARATIGDHDVLVTDAAASEALSRAAEENDETLRQRLLAEASARLYVSAQASASAPILVGLDRDENRDAEALNEAITAVDSPGVALSGLLAAPAVPATLSTEPDSSRATSLQRMLASEVVLADFATILDDPQLLLSPKRIQIMRSTAVGLSASGFDDAVAAVEDATDQTLEAVDIPPASTIQLLSANADLPFSVRNDLPWPVSVRLFVSPSDPRLDVERTKDAVIQPGTTSRVKIPVSARVGSGEVDLDLSLTSLTGVPIGTPETVRVAVRAEWETIGLAVFGGLIVLLLGVGTIRTVRRRRREAGTEAATPAESAAVEQSQDREPR